MFAMVVDDWIIWELRAIGVEGEVLNIHFHQGRVALLVQIVGEQVKFQKVKLVGRVMVQVVLREVSAVP